MLQRREHTQPVTAFQAASCLQLERHELVHSELLCAAYEATDMSSIAVAERQLHNVRVAVHLLYWDCVCSAFGGSCQQA